jgi:hypothetical protein
LPQNVGPVKDEIGDLGSEADVGQKVSCQVGLDAGVVLTQFVVNKVLQGRRYLAEIWRFLGAHFTSFAVINMFHGIKVPTPWRTKIKYTKLYLQQKIHLHQPNDSLVEIPKTKFAIEITT